MLNMICGKYHIANLPFTYENRTQLDRASRSGFGVLKGSLSGPISPVIETKAAIGKANTHIHPSRIVFLLRNSCELKASNSESPICRGLIMGHAKEPCCGLTDGVYTRLVDNSKTSPRGYDSVYNEHSQYFSEIISRSMIVSEETSLEWRRLPVYDITPVSRGRFNT
jgi:hypothetical protein